MTPIKLVVRIAVTGVGGHFFYMYIYFTLTNFKILGGISTWRCQLDNWDA